VIQITEASQYWNYRSLQFREPVFYCGHAMGETLVMYRTTALFGGERMMGRYGSASIADGPIN
jgi:hypothetical protein